MCSGVGRLVAVVVVAAGVLVAPQAAFAQQAISVSPRSGPPGTLVTVTGSGFTHEIYAAGVPIDISVNHGNGQWDSLQNGVAHPRPNAEGLFTATFPIPAHAPVGALLAISAVTGDGGSADADFTVTGQITTPPAEEPPSGPPAMPTKLTVIPSGPRTIEIEWQDNSINEIGFVISNGDEERWIIPDQTSHSWAVDPGSYMCVKVKAAGRHGDSDWFPNSSPWYACTTTPASSRRGRKDDLKG
jgi:hypothetical protein